MPQTLDYLDILERTHTGLKMARSDWDMDKVLLPVRKLVKKHDLQWDKKQIVPNDPDLADRVFQAGLALAQQSGVYAISTGRVIKFSIQEIQTAMDAMPASLDMGEGSDARTLYARQIMDQRPPLVWAGNPGVPTPEPLFLPMVKSWMQEPIVDMATCGSLTHVRGYPVRTGEPIEIAATRNELRWLRQGLREVGRPGMGLLAAQSGVSEIGDLAAAHPDYLRTCDAHLVAMFNELIISQDNMARAANAIEYGMRNASLATVMVGGLGGDAPGAAVVQVASFLLANLVCMADYHLLHPIHIRHVATSSPAVMWVQSIVQQAFARNAPCIIVSDIYPKSGAMTRELLYETAANAIAITVSGGHLEGVGSADGALPNGSGLEARLMGEVGHAVARQGLSLAEAETLIQRLLPRYQRVFKQQNGNPGLPFDQVYDLQSLRPLPAWQRMYDEARKQLNEMGLDLANS
jgi:methylamine---corrinoid protein Co-methyltransferase